MWERVKENDLCPKLSGLQIAKGLCFSHQSGTCKGACQGVETAKKYNKRAQKAIDSFFEAGETVAIVGKGRKPDEKSVVLVENGNYQGFGFFDTTENISNLDAARMLIKPSKDNRVVQNIVNSYLTNPKGVELVLFN
jgi:DNA polymerase III subunit epsilon